MQVINLNDRLMEIGYKDINLIPRKCIVSSREECDTSITFGSRRFAMPVFPANMKSVVNEKTCEFLASKGWFYAMHRFGINQIEFIKKMHELGLYASVSIGVNGDSQDELENMLETNNIPEYVVIDVANAWSEKVKIKVEWIRKNMPTVFLIVGNVATSGAVREIQDWGACALKIGIAGGCFVEGTIVIVKSGCKKIEDIEIGDFVLTHRNRFKKVLAISSRKEKKLIRIDNVVCTLNHEFYVLDKKYQHIVNDNNINEYAEWIPAENLDKNKYFIIKSK